MSPPVGPRQRRFHKRTKDGCLTCRARRKRCTQEKPICLGCRRNSLTCSWSHNDELERSSFSPNTLRPCGKAAPAHDDNVHLTRNVLHADEYEDDSLRMAVSNNVLAASADSLGDKLKEPSIELPLNSLLLLNGLETTECRKLFQHFFESTAVMLATRPQPRNPFIHCLLPMAISDKSIMHTVLAISGSHLASSHKDDSVYPLAKHYYSLAIHAARQRIVQFLHGRCGNPLVLVTLLLSLCQFECVDGDMRGAVLCHLKAAIELFSSMGNLLSNLEPSFYSFLLEQFIYLCCVSQNVGLGHEKPNLELLNMLAVLKFPACQKHHGFMFGLAYKLYRIIPKIQLAAWHCHSETSTDNSSILAELESLRGTINDWQPHEIANEAANKTLSTAAYMYQHALYIYLYCAIHGPHPPNLHLLFQINAHIEGFFILMDELPSSSPAWTTMLWPVLVIGSCLRHDRQQDHLTRVVASMVQKMYIIPRVLQILRWLWNTDPETAFGPYGIEKIMLQKQVRVSLG